MRVAVSAETKDGLDSVVSPHFGRCPYFVLVDLDGSDVQQVRAEDNPFYKQHQPGQVPGFIHSLGVSVMLTGGMGRRAILFFEDYGIVGVTGAYGTVRQSIESYLGGKLLGAAPCKESQTHHHGELPAEGEYEQDEVGRLQEEAEMLRQQLEVVSKRLDQLGQ
jgi:predicted Fe-Mo cluster-binding NifX family protein